MAGSQKLLQKLAALCSEQQTKVEQLLSEQRKLRDSYEAIRAEHDALCECLQLKSVLSEQELSAMRCHSAHSWPVAILKCNALFERIGTFSSLSEVRCLATTCTVDRKSVRQAVRFHLSQGMTICAIARPFLQISAGVQTSTCDTITAFNAKRNEWANLPTSQIQTRLLPQSRVTWQSNDAWRSFNVLFIKTVGEVLFVLWRVQDARGEFEFHAELYKYATREWLSAPQPPDRLQNSLEMLMYDKGFGQAIGSKLYFLDCNGANLTSFDVFTLQWSCHTELLDVSPQTSAEPHIKSVSRLGNSLYAKFSLPNWHLDVLNVTDAAPTWKALNNALDDTVIASSLYRLVSTADGLFLIVEQSWREGQSMSGVIYQFKSDASFFAFVTAVPELFPKQAHDREMKIASAAHDIFIACYGRSHNSSQHQIALNLLHFNTRDMTWESLQPPAGMDVQPRAYMDRFEGKFLQLIACGKSLYVFFHNQGWLWTSGNWQELPLVPGQGVRLVAAQLLPQ